jgi:TonB-dependent SusC/RagA subfamily outer membrane receptor
MKRKLRLFAYPAKYFSLSFILLLFAFFASAQKQVSGVVKSATGPVAGATVAVKDATVATQTAADGTFSITVPSGKSVLVISYVGLETREVDISNQTSVDLTLAAVVSSLNEVIVTGYSAQRKKDIIGAVSVVDIKQLQMTPSQNIASQLQGRAPGVVVSSAGEPGVAAVVRIRGFNSANNNDPLYIVDGVPTTDPSKFNPNDIESMQVLKDASAASIYGSRASNGVIIITTKQGKAGRMIVTYDGYYGSQTISESMMPEMLNTAEYMQ